MDSMFDLVRDRTADLRRVADDVRRERDLRTPAPSVPATRATASTTSSRVPSASSSATVAPVAADPCEAPCASSGARQAA